MFTIGNEELNVLPALLPEEACPICKTLRPIQYGKSKDPATGEMVETKTLAVINCCDKTFLVGLAGKKL